MESWNPISSFGKRIQDTRVQPLNLHQKLGILKITICKIGKEKDIALPMKLVISDYLSRHGKGRMN
jgi:hypothetical protein